MRIIVDIDERSIRTTIKALIVGYTGLEAFSSVPVLRYVMNRLLKYIPNMIENELEYIIEDLLNEYYEV